MTHGTGIPDEIRCPKCNQLLNILPPKYGSDLNAHVDKQLTRHMGAGNIDLYLQKDDVNGVERLRIIESKHSGEYKSESQMQILTTLAEMFERDNKSNSGLLAEVFIIEGNKPSTKGVKIINIKGTIADPEDVEEFNRFLEFELEFEDMLPKRNNA